MKSFINSLLAVLFLYQALSTTFILVNFELNRERIAKTLCVKKAERGNCCQGSCHLKKQLQAEEKKEQAPARNPKLVKQFPLFCQKQAGFDLQPLLMLETGFLPFQCSKITSHSAAIFHPPCYSA